MKQTWFFFAFSLLIISGQNCGMPKSKMVSEPLVNAEVKSEVPDKNILAEERIIESKAPTGCHARNFMQLSDCFSQARLKEPGTVFDIAVLQDIVLKKDEVIRIENIDGVRIFGSRSDGKGKVISETAERLRLDTSDNKYMLEIGSGAKNVVIEDLNFYDPPGAAGLLKVRCRTGAHLTNPNLWDPSMCYAPILVGGVAPAENVNLKNVSVNSWKALLIEVRSTKGLSFNRCRLEGGTVTGLFFNAAYRHIDTKITSSYFTMSGTSAVTFTNASEILVENSTFVNNHIDPQYRYTDADGKSAYYPGGQLYIADVGGPVDSVRFINNVLSMTKEYLGQQTTVGIEVMSGDSGAISDVLIEGNRIFNMPRTGISVHYGKVPKHHNIIIRGNTLKNVMADFPKLALRHEYAISLERTPHPGVDVYGNQVMFSEGKVYSATFAGSTKSCVVPANKNACVAKIKVSGTGFPPDARLTVRVNGQPFKSFSGNSSQAIFNAVKKGTTTTFSLHFGAEDSRPAVATWNVTGE